MEGSRRFKWIFATPQEFLALPSLRLNLTYHVIELACPTLSNWNTATPFYGKNMMMEALAYTLII